MMRMATGPVKKHDPLEDAKIGKDGEPPAVRNGKDQARELLAEAIKMFPHGVPDDSPFAKMSRDGMLNAGNSVGMTLGPLMQLDELRLALEYWRQKKQVQAPLASTPVGSKPLDQPPPVPSQPVRKRKIRGVPHSESGAWTVMLKDVREPKRVSIAGQICTLRQGAKIEARHYTEQQIQSMVEQGVELKPWVEGAEDDDY